MAIEIKGKEERLPIDQVRPNPWNYNKQSDKEFTKLGNSMEKWGFIERPIVREVDGGYEIIAGEHRWHQCKQQGVDIFPAINLGKVSDKDAKQLCIILNELHGKPDEVRLSELLRDIHQDGVGVNELLETMPYGAQELNMYLEAMDFRFDNLPAGDGKTDEEKAEELRLKLGWEGEEAKALIEKLAAIAHDPKKAVELAVEAFGKPKEQDE